jgi:hypothetical protein
LNGGFGYNVVHTFDDMVKHLPKDIMNNTKKVAETRWMFFRDMRNHLQYYPNVAFPATSVFRTEVQALDHIRWPGCQFTTIFSNLPLLKNKV